MQVTEDAKRILSSRGWLSQVPDDAREEIFARCTLRAYRANEPVYHIGDEVGAMFGLVEGSVAVSLASSEYGPYIGHLGRPGIWFGEISVILRETRRVAVTARRPTVMMQLPLKAIDELTASDPIYWRYLALNCALNLDLCLRGYSDLLVRDPRLRLAAVLLRLSDASNGLPDAAEEVRIDVTQSEIAELAGMSRNAAGRILAEMAASNVLYIGYGHLTIRRLDALRDIVLEAA